MITPHTHQAQDAATLSALLGALELRGQCWCYADLGAGGGFSVAPGDAALFHAVLHGAVRLTAPGGGTVELVAGDAVFVLSGEAHALRISADAAAMTLDFLREDRQADSPPSFLFGQPGTPTARVLSGRLAITLPAGTNRAALPTFYRLPVGDGAGLVTPQALALAGIGPGSAATLTRLAALLLAAALRADPQCRQLFSPQRQDPMAQALRLIAGNPSASWTVERLARSVGMGRSNFAAHFTQTMGRAPMEVVAEARMEAAAELLRRGKLKIAEIAELSGYGSEAAFSRRFSRHFGVSPSHMREAAKAALVSPAVPAWQPLLAGSREQVTAALLHRRAAAPVAAPGTAAPRTTILRDGPD